jgi:1-acyl-sn-glycerol-3-phosphate acyltransferase
MMAIKTFFYTIYSRILLVIIMLLAVVPALLLVFVVPQKYRYNRVYFALSGLLYWVIIKASLLPITIVGREHLPKEPAIYIANHVSSLDIPILGMLVGSKPHFWLAMKWLTKFWLFRLFLPRTAVLVDMENPQGNVRSLIRIMQMTKEQNMSAMIFPEGGRFVDDKIHSFYGGFTLLAKKSGFPVMPVRIYNLEKVYPPGTFWIHYYPVKVVIGEPMYIREDEDDEAFKERVYAWFVNQEQ